MTMGKPDAVAQLEASTALAERINAQHVITDKADLRAILAYVAELEGARKTDLDELLYVARNRFRDLGHRCEYRVRFEAIKQSLEAKAAALTGGEKGGG
jgi:hypothetical protein